MILSFQQWCELNGRRWLFAKDFDEFAKNAKDYDAYREKEATDES